MNPQASPPIDWPGECAVGKPPGDGTSLTSGGMCAAYRENETLTLRRPHGRRHNLSAQPVSRPVVYGLRGDGCRTSDSPMHLFLNSASDCSKSNITDPFSFIDLDSGYPGKVFKRQTSHYMITTGKIKTE